MKLSNLEKFKVPRHKLRTITFLLYDHIGGFNTLLYTLSNGGLIVTVSDRNPDGVLKAVEKHKVELLPTSPTFINLILLSEAYKRYNISSLKTVTYGTEPMPENTLKIFNHLLEADKRSKGIDFDNTNYHAISSELIYKIFNNN